MRVDLSLFRPSFWQAAFAGAAVALVGGLMVGSYFKAGYRFEQPLSGSGGLVFSEQAPAPVQYMTDASGRIPDYVLGTDFTAPPEPAPIILADYAAEPGLEAWDTPAPREIEIAPAATEPPAPPPSIGGDILAGIDRVQSDWSSPEPARPVPTQIVLEDGADPAAFRPREPQLAAAATY